MTIKASEIINKFKGKKMYKRVYKKHLGYAVSEPTADCHKLIEIMATKKIINDLHEGEFNVREYFMLQII